MNVVSAKSILLDTERVFKFKDKSWINSAVQSIGAAIQGIGTSIPLETICKPIQVSSKRAMLPKDCLGIRAIEYNSQRLPLEVGVPSAGRHKCGNGYWLNPGHIECPFLKGTIVLHYKRVPVDEEGFPMIVNNFDYKEAVKWWIVVELLSSGYEHKVFDYKMAWEKWEYHSIRACNAIKMPQSRDEMEVLGNIWTKQFNDGQFIHQFGDGLEYGDNDRLSYSLPNYVDRNRLTEL